METDRIKKGEKNIDHAELLRPYSGKWVVLSPDETRVIASGKTLEEATKKARKDGVEESVITLVPPTKVGMIL